MNGRYQICLSFILSPTLSFIFFFFCILSEFACRNGPRRWTSYESCDVNEDNAGFNLRFFLSHFISDKVCYGTKVRREKRRCFRKRISLFGSLVFVVFWDGVSIQGIRFFVSLCFSSLLLTCFFSPLSVSLLLFDFLEGDRAPFTIKQKKVSPAVQTPPYSLAPTFDRIPAV